MDGDQCAVRSGNWFLGVVIEKAVVNWPWWNLKFVYRILALPSFFINLWLRIWSWRSAWHEVTWMTCKPTNYNRLVFSIIDTYNSSLMRCVLQISRLEDTVQLQKNYTITNEPSWIFLNINLGAASSRISMPGFIWQRNSIRALWHFVTIHSWAQQGITLSLVCCSQCNDLCILWLNYIFLSNFTCIAMWSNSLCPYDLNVDVSNRFKSSRDTPSQWD